jgi:PAS domain S-box-containing protein
MVNTVFELAPQYPVGWYTGFIDSIPVGMYRTTIEGELIFCNRAFAQLFGFKKVEELIGYPVVKLYKNCKDRGLLIENVIKHGRVTDLPLYLVKRNGRPMVCSVSARAVLDDDGVVVYLDGVIRELSDTEDEESHSFAIAKDKTGETDFVFLLNLRGEMVDMNHAYAELLGFGKEELTGKSLFEFMVLEEKYHFPLFLSELLQSGQQEGILAIIDRGGARHYLGFHALLVEGKGGLHLIKVVAQEATKRMKHHKQQLSKERLLGVMEMAGGVAHALNQPLTIIGNLLHEVLSDFDPHERNYKKIVKIDTQIQKLNELVRKIGAIDQYEAVEYVAGVRIVDIDKASRMKQGGEIG